MSEEICVFNDDLKESEECFPEVIPIVNEFFNTVFTKSPLHLDKQGSDISDGKIHIDVKYNKKYDNTNFIAEWSSKFDSWLMKEDSITDYLLWWTTNQILLINFKTLQKKCLKNEFDIKQEYGLMYKTSKRGNSSWTVPISIVPMKDVKDHIIKTWDR